MIRNSNRIEERELGVTDRLNRDVESRLNRSVGELRGMERGVKELAVVIGSSSSSTIGGDSESDDRLSQTHSDSDNSNFQLQILLCFLVGLVSALFAGMEFHTRMGCRTDCA